MEILSLLRLNLWRLGALLAVSAICAALAAFSIAGRPVSYTADATVFVARALPSTASAFEVTPFAADFEATTQLTSIRTVVAERLGLPLEDVVVTTERPEGSTVKVLASHSDGPTAELIASSMASASLEFLARDRVERSDQLLSDRQTTADAATAALRAFEEENGYTDVVREYDTRVVQMLELEGRAEDESADFTLAERRQLSELARDIRDELPALATKRDRYLDLSQTADESKFALDSVINERRNAEAGLISATTSNITSTEAAPVSKIPLIVQAAVAATMVVFALGIALFFLVDLLRDRRSASESSDSDVADLTGSNTGRKPVEQPTPSVKPDDTVNTADTDSSSVAVDETVADKPAAAERVIVPSTELKPVRVLSTQSNGSTAKGRRSKSTSNGKTAPAVQETGSSERDQPTPEHIDRSDDEPPASTASPSGGGRVIAMNSGASSARNGTKRSKASTKTSSGQDTPGTGKRPAAGLTRNPRDIARDDDPVIKPAVGDGATPPIGSTPGPTRRRTKISKGRG